MEEYSNTAIVIGAGVVGLATAVFLQRAGKSVTVIDPFPPAGGCSFGNAGMISPNSVVPMSMPGMLRRVPGWVLDPAGPLVVRKQYLLSLMPWLLKWIRAGRLDKALEISDGLRALSKDTHAYWLELVGPQRYADLVRPEGQVHLAEGDVPGGRRAAAECAIHARHGVRFDFLSTADIRRLFPGIAGDISHGYLVPGNGYTTNPARLVASVGETFVREGGVLVSERALKLVPEGTGITVLTNTSNRRAKDVVVAAGAFSDELLRPLGIKVPLEAERGYHAMLPEANLTSLRPLIFKSRGFAMTPMENGVRVAGTVEFTYRHEAPDQARALQLASKAKRLFPGLTHGEPTLWMGSRPSLPDSLPIIGPVTSIRGLHLAFGNGSTGMTTGPATARLAADMVVGGNSRIDPRPYQLNRQALRH